MASEAYGHNLHNHQRQKRARSQLSCVPCRSGKLKCDRSHDPACDQCIKRNRVSACLYVPPPVKQKLTQNVNGRIRQLESLVVDLMNQQNKNAPSQSSYSDAASSVERQESSSKSISTHRSEPTPPSDNDYTSQNAPTASLLEDSPVDVDGATKPFGRMTINKGEISYVGDSHWQAILNGISALKRDLGDDEESGGDDDDDEQSREQDDATDSLSKSTSFATPAPPPHCPLASGAVPMGGIQPHATTGLGFMLGLTSELTKDQLIAGVPEKRVADRLLSLWFNSPDPFKPIIHGPTFQETYKRFWRNPKDTPVMWLGLMFAIMSLAASFALRDVHPDNPDLQEKLAEVNRYHSFSASAAVLADFTKPKKYTVECLMLYAAGMRANDGFVNVWLMVGLIVRVALRMGYHRDSSKYPAITTFEGEMRRRVWAIILMIDVLGSFQLGLPPMVKTIQSDTQPPQNLLDRDFGTKTEVLPVSRGDDELTPSSYTRAKLRIVHIFADASELSHATTPPSREEIMELDRKLDEAKSEIPPLLQMPDISELVTDPAEQLMCRFNLDLLYLKTKIVLHRRYMEKPFSQLTPEEQIVGIGYSRRTCIDCALQVLHHHHTIYSASQPGGQLDSVKWYMGSISTHDFLLAAMVICLELSQQISGYAFRDKSHTQCSQRMAMMDALEKSQKIWSNASAIKRQMMQSVAKNAINGGTYIFDDTEKASRSMAVMIEKVKARFPAQASDFSWENNSPAPTTTVSEKSPSVSTLLNLDMPENLQLSFTGVISNHEWGNMSGVPDNLQLGITPSTGTSSNLSSNTVPMNFGGFAQSASDEPYPQRDIHQSDLTMIEDMLDVQGDVDWAAWDLNFNKGEHMEFSDDYLPEPIQDKVPALTPGNALVGGSGPVAMPNKDVSGRTPANNPTPTRNTFPGSWMAFPDMIDFDFDLENGMDYTKSGQWSG